MSNESDVNLALYIMPLNTILNFVVVDPMLLSLSVSLCKYFQPSLTFVGKAEANPSERSIRGPSLW
jgi:hypothetical protein